MSRQLKLAHFAFCSLVFCPRISYSPKKFILPKTSVDTMVKLSFVFLRRRLSIAVSSPLTVPIICD
jgi:hypothetical protein